LHRCHKEHEEAPHLLVTPGACWCGDRESNLLVARLVYMMLVKKLLWDELDFSK